MIGIVNWVSNISLNWELRIYLGELIWMAGQGVGLGDRRPWGRITVAIGQ